MRTEIFLENWKIWSLKNIGTVAVIAFGLLMASRVHRDNPRAHICAGLVCLSTFAEIMIFSSTWIPYSDTPARGTLFPEDSWVEQLKSHTGNGTVFLPERSDFDYMQLNTPSAYGIRFAQGYETVTPLQVVYPSILDAPLSEWTEAGVSHALFNPRKSPAGLPGWTKVVDTNEIVLFRNPDFSSIYLAAVPGGKEVPLFPEFETNNRRHLLIPVGATAVMMNESWALGWKFRMAGEDWKDVSRSARNTMELNFPPVQQETAMELEYRPPFQRLYRVIILVTLIVLIIYLVLRRKIS